MSSFSATGIFLGLCWTGVTFLFISRCNLPDKCPNPSKTSAYFSTYVSTEVELPIALTSLLIEIKPNISLVFADSKGFRDTFVETVSKRNLKNLSLIFVYKLYLPFDFIVAPS